MSKEPDLPCSFGYKIGWFSVAAEDSAQVCRVLELEDCEVANWSSGLGAAYKNNTDFQERYRPVFVTPPLDGWVLIIGSCLPYPLGPSQAKPQSTASEFEILLSRLTQHFNEVQYFASHRVSSFVSWARQSNTNYRAFTYGDGWVYCNTGEQTPTERKLGFPDLSGLNETEALDELVRLDDLRSQRQDELTNSGLNLSEVLKIIPPSPFPNEENVTELAAEWSIDPTTIAEKFTEKSLGYYGILKYGKR